MLVRALEEKDLEDFCVKMKDMAEMGKGQSVRRALVATSEGDLNRTGRFWRFWLFLLCLYLEALWTTMVSFGQQNISIPCRCYVVLI